jgi:hypothetical protein
LNYKYEYSDDNFYKILKPIKILFGKDKASLHIQGIDKDKNMYIREQFDQDGGYWFYKMDYYGNILDELLDRSDGHDPNWNGIDPKIIPFKTNNRQCPRLYRSMKS